jgi:hypothetical protein
MILLFVFICLPCSSLAILIVFAACRLAAKADAGTVRINPSPQALNGGTHNRYTPDKNGNAK